MKAGLRYALVVALALAVRAALIPAPGFPTDVSAFQDWALVLATAGPHALYADLSGRNFPVVDYPPGYAYVLWATGSFYLHALGQHDPRSLLLRVLVKLPAVAADFGLAAVLRALALRCANERAAFGVFAAALLAPPLWLVSADWGQVDSVAVLVFAAALWAMLARRFVAGWTVFAAAVLTKPQALAAFPALALYHARARASRAGIALEAFASLAAGTLTAYLIALPFAPVADPAGVLRWTFARYARGVDKYPNASTGAFNLYGIAGPFFSSDARTFAGLSLRTWGALLVALALAGIGVRLWHALGSARDARERERALVLATFLSLAALFLLATRMHERYLLPALAAGAVAAAYDRRAALATAVFAATFTVNCAFILAGFAGGKHHPATLLAGHALAFLNVATFGAMLAAYLGSPLLRRGRERPLPVTRDV